MTSGPVVQEAREIPVPGSEDLSGSFPLFREGDEAWRSMPPWAQFFLRAGHQLQSTAGDTRRIFLLTLPCESAAAALLALGAMRFRLAQEGADDLAAHFARIRALAGARHTTHTLCDIRHRGKRAGPFRVRCAEPDTGHVWVQHISQPEEQRLITPLSSSCWRFQDEPALQLHNGKQLSSEALYGALLPDAGPVCPDNLARSDSLVCLMTRVAGEAATRTMAAGIRLSAGGQEAGLDELLTVRQWGGERISRVVLFNTRKAEPDRQTRPPRLIVADGDQAFMKALDEPWMQQADVIGIVPRTLERDRLEVLGHRLVQLEQWYQRRDPRSAGLPDWPAGVAAGVLTRKEG